MVHGIPMPKGGFGARPNKDGTADPSAQAGDFPPEKSGFSQNSAKSRLFRESISRLAA
jgi:hypothetical protein